MSPSVFKPDVKSCATINTPPLSLYLFGPLRVLVNGEPMPRVRTRSVEWLLALLILRHGREVDRLWLAGTLWPESEESQALQNLRHALVSLRKALGAESGRIQSPTRDLLTLDLEGAEADLIRFDAAIRAADEDSLTGAIDAYAGPLLEGCHAEWALIEREARAQQCLQALDVLAGHAQARGDHGRAIRFLQRAESLDPLRDSTARGLMASLEAVGDPAAAVEVYRRLLHRLHDELSAEPSEDTMRLFREIRERARSKSERRSQAPETSPLSPVARIPNSLTRIIGRDEEVASVRERVAQNRLVTLIGAGGIGKTRLAMEVAGEFAGGIAWVELAPLADDALLLPTLAAALGIRQETEAESLMDQIVTRLSAGAFLLGLDNCEHVLNTAAAVVQQLLSRCPSLHVLATSRQRFGLTGEVTWRVPSLPFPPPEETGVSEYPAVQLFIERAVMARSDFQIVGPEDAQAIARICQRLDGIPLAIELAAARVGTLSVGQIASRLGDRFRLLTTGSRGAFTRHQTLRALIDWSYDLLTAEEQALLGRLSVFAGGWTLEAAEAVTSEDVLDLLASLVDKSLVLSEKDRYRMLETVREYATEKLGATEEAVSARDRHLSFYLGQVCAPDTESAIRFLETELDNLRLALAWAQGSEAYLQLVVALGPFWATRSYLSEGRIHFRTALKLIDSPLRPQVLLGATRLAVLQGDIEEALALGQECLERFQEQRDSRGIAETLLYMGEGHTMRHDFTRSVPMLTDAVGHARQSAWPQGVAQGALLLGSIHILQREMERGRSFLEEGLTLAEAYGPPQILAKAYDRVSSLEAKEGNEQRARTLVEMAFDIHTRLGDRLGIANALVSLGILDQDLDRERSIAYYEEALAIHRELGNAAEMAHVLHRIGFVHYTRGEYEPARQAYAESLAMVRSLRGDGGFEYVRMDLGSALFHLGEWMAAKELYQESLALYHRAGNEEGIAWAMERIGVVESLHGGAREAAQLLGAASAMREAIGIPMVLADSRDWEEAVAAVRGALPKAVFDSLWEEGRRMMTEEAIRLSLSSVR